MGLADPRFAEGSQHLLPVVLFVFGDAGKGPHAKLLRLAAQFQQAGVNVKKICHSFLPLSLNHPPLDLLPEGGPGGFLPVGTVKARSSLANPHIPKLVHIIVHPLDAVGEPLLLFVLRSGRLEDQLGLGIALAYRQQIFAALVHVAVHQVQQEGDYPFFQQSGLPPPQKPLPVGDGLLQHRRVPIPQPNKQMGGIIALLLS